MKKYIDIENLREFDLDIGNGSIRKGNAHLFEVGDIISITEKRDGSNASATWENNQVKVFSRRMELNYNNTLNGFYNHILSLPENIFSENPDYIFFGEWGTKNKLIYTDNNTTWYIFDIWDKVEEKWLNPTIVKELCSKYNLTYINELYYGSFISWEHCRTFMNKPAYGDKQEGCVVRNITKFNSPDSRLPFILKIVNEDFKESMAEKVIDPEKEKAKLDAEKLGGSICTENRILKCLTKLQEDKIIPLEITPKDMKIVAQNLPKAVFDDCLKEEKEIVMAMGEYAGKIINSLTMKTVRNLIVGQTL